MIPFAAGAAWLAGQTAAHGDILSGGLSWLPVDQTVNWSYDAIRAEFGDGGQFAGFRHASLSEVWSLVESYGFDTSAPAEANYAAVYALQGDLGYTFASSAGQFNSWTLGFTGDGTRLDLRVTLPDPGDSATWQGFAYETDYPFFDVATPEVGHYLVTAVPEPAATAALLGLLVCTVVYLRIRSQRHGTCIPEGCMPLASGTGHASRRDASH